MPSARAATPRGRRLLAGRSRRFALADLVVRIEAEASLAGGVELARWLDPFETRRGAVDLPIRLGLGAAAGRDALPVVFDSGLNWRVRAGGGRLVYEFVHPPTGRVLATAETGVRRDRYDVRFDPSTVRRLGRPGRPPRPPLFASPLDQLLFVPRLALEDGLLLHAAAVVLDGTALVLAGHSGDGKTTLGRALLGEGHTVLGDERVALRISAEGTVRVYGTPWPGEGGIVSAASAPLGGIFVLGKAERHRVVDLPPAAAAARLLARAIVPYFLPRETEAIVALVDGIVREHPVRELRAALAPGIVDVLRRAA